MQTIEIDRLDLSPGDWILDVGCGEGRHMHGAYWNHFVNVVGIDLDASSLEEARNGFNEMGTDQEGHWSVYRADALELPFPDSTFDTVICSEVLEHLPDYRSALREIDRVVKPEGTVAVSVPRYGPEKICWLLSDEYHEVDGGHVRIFDQRELKASIEAQGYRCTRTHYAHALHSPFWWLKCLFWDDHESSTLVSAYNGLLEWDLLEDPLILDLLESLLDPLMGKSYVLYFQGETN